MTVEAALLEVLAEVNQVLWPDAHVHRCAGHGTRAPHVHGCTVRICAEQLERLCFPCKIAGAT